MNDADYQALLERSMEELRMKTDFHDGTWHLADANWAVDQVTGLITFTGPTIIATAPVQIIGTYSTNGGTWMWGWDHPSVKAPLAVTAKKVREFGEKNGIPSLTTRKFESAEEEAWQFAALACYLTQAQGAYRGPAGVALVFMTFGEVKLAKNK